MISHRKSISLFFAFLVLFLSISNYSISQSALTTGTVSSEESLSFVSENPAQFYWFQEKTSSSSDYQGMKSVTQIPGLCTNKGQVPEIPHLTEIRKFFVVDVSCFTPGKTLLLFPFHDFL